MRRRKKAAGSGLYDHLRLKVTQRPGHGAKFYAVLHDFQWYGHNLQHLVISFLYTRMTLWKVSDRPSSVWYVTISGVMWREMATRCKLWLQSFWRRTRLTHAACTQYCMQQFQRWIYGATGVLRSILRADLGHKRTCHPLKLYMY